MGMQYRIDHLENLKADVFDQIAHPITKIKGTTVEAFEWGPGVQIECGEEGDVEVLHPDTTALNADMQIDHLMARMEELAGAPKQAMGIRTPGEKTKYEVQVLENGAGRIFSAKVNWFEKNILEPLLNSMLEESRRNLVADTFKTTDPETGADIFVDITREDLMSAGNLRPVGSRHFAEQAKFIQELDHTLQTVQGIPGPSSRTSRATRPRWPWKTPWAGAATTSSRRTWASRRSWRPSSSCRPPRNSWPATVRPPPRCNPEISRVRQILVKHLPSKAEREKFEQWWEHSASHRPVITTRQPRFLKRPGP